MTRIAWLVGAALVTAGPLAAQEFHPPPVERSGGRGTRLGLLGFGVRGGVDLSGGARMVFGVTLDAGNLFSDRLRIRPAGEIGVFSGSNSYVASLEAVYSFTDDREPAMPYAGAGFGIAGRAGCSAEPQCPDLWLNLVVGLELRYRSTFNWLLEYHPMDAFRHNRIYVGLATRRGN